MHCNVVRRPGLYLLRVSGFEPLSPHKKTWPFVVVKLEIYWYGTVVFLMDIL